MVVDSLGLMVVMVKEGRRWKKVGDGLIDLETCYC